MQQTPLGVILFLWVSFGSMRVFRYLKLQPFDDKSPEGRAAERYRMAAWAILANVAGKAASLAVMVLSVSLTLPYLGAQRFGIWMTIASFSGMLTFLGMGVGNALTNLVATRSAAADYEIVRRTISGGLGLLLMVGLSIALGLYVMVDWLPWSRMIKTTNATLLMEAQQTGKVFALLFGLNLFTTGIQSVFAGLQRTFEVHLVNTVGAVLALGALWIASHAQAGLTELLLATLGVQTLTSLSLLVLLARRRYLTLVRLRFAIQAEAGGLLQTGGLFFVLQIGTMVGWGSDALIISSTLGPASVAIYSVATRLFQFVTQPLAIMNAPLWGAYVDAHAKGDIRFIKKTLKASLQFTVSVSCVASFILFVTGPWLLTFWTRGAIDVPIMLLALVAVWTIFDSCGAALGMFLNGLHIVRQQVIVVTTFCLLVLPLKIMGAAQFGLIAIPLAAITVYALTHVLFYGVLFLPQIKSKLTEIDPI
jgi:O-antigen/teichoic acid export membrane protein